MIVHVQLFAGARDRVGQGTVSLEMPDDATVQLLRRRLAEALPQLADLLPRTMIAVDQDYAADGVPLHPNSEVAVIPPVSGG